MLFTRLVKEFEMEVLWFVAGAAVVVCAGWARKNRALGVSEVYRGRVRLLSDPSRYRASFKRFDGDALNGWIPSKETLAGEEGRVVEVFDDRTITLELADGARLDFPFESVEEQLTVEE